MDHTGGLSAGVGEDKHPVRGKDDMTISSVKPQEDVSGSVESCHSELVASGFGKLCKLHRQFSKSWSNTEEYANKEECKKSYNGGQEKHYPMTHSAESIAPELNGPRSCHRSLQQNVHDVSLATQDGLPPNLDGESGNIYQGISSSTSSFIMSLQPHHQQGLLLKLVKLNVCINFFPIK